MTRGLGRTVAAALLGALAGAALLSLFYNLQSGLLIDFAIQPPRQLSGVYPVERDPVALTTFAWTRDRVTLRLTGLDRHQAWRLLVRARGARTAPAVNPEMAIAADGIRLLAQRSSTDYEILEVAIPASAERRGLTVTLDVSETFTPGAADPRALGVMVDWIRLEPAGVVLPPRDALYGASLSAAAFGAALALLGVTAGSAIGGTLLVAVGVSAVLARGFAPFTTLPWVASRLALWLAIGLVCVAGLLRMLRGVPLRHTARFVGAFSIAAVMLKALVLLHPDTPVGDALFQAHRFQAVLGGQIFFTSIAPGNYLFPYAPGFYLAAAPFAGLVNRGLDDMALLRVLAVVVDAAVALSLYGVMTRTRGDRLAGALAVALYHLIPLDFGVLRTGNLTNAFAQSISVLALALLAAGDLRPERRAALALFGSILLVAFLSHTSTFAILTIACLTIAHLFFWHGGAARRPPALAVAPTVGIAVLLAVVFYYGHFLDTYRTELARLGGETASAAADAGGRSIADRLFAVPRYLRIYLGLPVLMLGVYGAAGLWQRRAADGLALALAGWILACTAFLVLGVLTPLDMRYYLAVIPAVALLAGIGAGRAWGEGWQPRALAAALLLWAAGQGIHDWWTTIA